MRSLEEIKAEWRKALKEHDEAVVQYEPFLAKTNLTPGQDPVPIPYNDLKAAHDRLKGARERLKQISNEHLEYVKSMDQ